MIDGLTIKRISSRAIPSNNQLVEVEVIVIGQITKEEIESLEYCSKGNYDFALYAAPRQKVVLGQR